MQNLHDIPGRHVEELYFPAQTGSAASAYISAWRAPFKCNLKALRYVPIAAITGDNTNTSTLYAKDMDGNPVASLAFGTGQDAALGVAENFSVAAAYQALDEGDVLLFQRIKANSGLNLPAGTLVVEYEGR